MVQRVIAELMSFRTCSSPVRYIGGLHTSSHQKERGFEPRSIKAPTEVLMSAGILDGPSV